MLNKLKTLFLLLKSGKLDLFFYKLYKKLSIKNMLPPLPQWLIIEPINICNLRCPICPVGTGKMNRPKRAMSLGEFEKIINEVKGYVKKIVLFNLGEPFLNKDFLDMVKYAVSAEMKVKISTNGTLFNSPDFCKRIVQSGLQHLIISLDGLDQKTLSKYRRGANFDNIVRGLKYLIEVKKELGSILPKIELQFLVMKHNEHQRKAMEGFAKRLGVDIYSEKSLDLHSEDDDSDFWEKAKEFLPSDSYFSRYKVSPNGKVILRGKSPKDCSLIYQSAVINSNGDVIPCCYDIYSKYIMGNVFKKSLREIWKGEKYQSFRKRIKKNKKSIPMCRSCPVGRNISTSIKAKMK